MQVVGEFNAQRFFDTLAMLLSKREGVDISVKVTRRETEERKQAESTGGAA